MPHSQWVSRRLHNEGGGGRSGQTEISQGLAGSKGPPHYEGSGKAQHIRELKLTQKG